MTLGHMCYRHPDREAHALHPYDAMGTPIFLCVECLTAFSLWLNDAHLVAPTGADR